MFLNCLDFLAVGTDSSNPLLVEFARITHSFPVDLNIDAEPIFNSTTIGDAVHICVLGGGNCSLALNFSPWFPGSFGTSWSTPFGGPEEHALEFYRTKLQDTKAWVAEANRRFGSEINVSAVLLDQEPGWSVKPDTNLSYIDAMTRKADLVYNLTLEVFPDIKIDLFGWGSVEKAVGLSKLPCKDPSSCANGNSAAGTWCGMGGGWGNEDVKRCGCNGYTLRERSAASGPDLYMVGNMDRTIEQFNRTANAGLAHGATQSNPWVWLGGGYRQLIAMDGGFNIDFKWDYDLVNSWMLGRMPNDPFYGQHPSRFGRFDLVDHVNFWPSPVGTTPSKVERSRFSIDPTTGETSYMLCNVMIGHFVAYCFGANGILHDFGQHTCGAPDPAAFDAILKSDDHVAATVTGSRTPSTSRSGIISSRPARVLKLKKQIRWFLGDQSSPAPFLLGSNANGSWANSTLNASDITGGVINCCGTYGVLGNGSVEVPAGGHVKTNSYQQYRQAGRQVLVSLAPGDSNAALRSAWCWNTLVRLPAFTEEVMALIDGLAVDGINLDWERGANNSIPCFLQIWGSVSKAMRAQGGQLTPGV